MNSVVLDIPRIYTGLAEWLACMVMVAPYRKSMSFGRFWSISVSGLAVICAFLIVTDNIALWLWIPCMAFACAIMLTLILLLGQLDFRSGIYTCIRAFILAEFAAALQWQIHCFFGRTMRLLFGRNTAF